MREKMTSHTAAKPVDLCRLMRRQDCWLPKMPEAMRKKLTQLLTHISMHATSRVAIGFDK